jgi:hypothetical protein
MMDGATQSASAVAKGIRESQKDNKKTRLKITYALIDKHSVDFSPKSKLSKSKSQAAPKARQLGRRRAT